MAPKLSETDRRLLGLALEKYRVEWDEPLGRIHPHLAVDRCVARPEDWLGSPGRPGIVGWKSRRALAKASWDPGVPRVTKAAFTLASSGSSEKLIEAVELLDGLGGVGVRVATAILMFYDPGNFSVMDVNAWRSLVHLGFVDVFDLWYEDSEHYPKYNRTCIELSRQFRHALRDTDRALWILGDTAGHPEEYETP
jgi:hypothetical protein